MRVLVFVIVSCVRNIFFVFFYMGYVWEKRVDVLDQCGFEMVIKISILC